MICEYHLETQKYTLWIDLQREYIEVSEAYTVLETFFKRKKNIKL